MTTIVGTPTTTDDGGVLGVDGNQGNGGVSGGGLARTGSNLAPLGAFGVMLLGLGAVFVAKSRRRQS